MSYVTLRKQDFKIFLWIIIAASFLKLEAQTEPPNKYWEYKNFDNEECFRCHAMATLSYKHQETGIIKNLAVLPSDFNTSNHKNISCIMCHSIEFKEFPHPAQLKEEKLNCIDCHITDPTFDKFNFAQIETEFMQSVHHRELGDNFTCFNCHDPHTFKTTARNNTNIKETVLYDNQICLDCHNQTDVVAEIYDRVLPNIVEVHKWLPHQDLHWANVRCIDCHADSGTETVGVSHLIQPASMAVRNCVECHSTDSRLVHTLYKFQIEEERDQQGFFNAVMLNNSYIIGATRNYYLNLLSFIIFGLVIAGIVIHSLLRYAAYRRRDND